MNTASRMIVAFAATVMAAGPLAASDDPPSERVIDVEARVIPMSVDGQWLQMEVTPDAPVQPVLSPAAAERLELGGSLVSGVHLVGRTRMRASSNRVRIDFGDGHRERTRAFFFDQPWGEASDGLLNPMALPETVVTYRLRDPVEGEQTIALPLAEHDRAGFHATLTLGNRDIPVLFSFARDETMLTAAAGVLLADAFGGRMSGEAYDVPIELGIARPVRPLVFERQPAMGRLSLGRLVVRTSDTGSVGAIPDDERDPNEIVVENSRREPPLAMWIGREALAHCSSLTFDRAAAEIRLSCENR